MSEKNLVFSYYFDKYIQNIFKDSMVFDEIYTGIIDSLMKLLAEKSTGNETLPRHKSTIEFFQKNVSITKLGEKFKDICL